MAAFAALAQLGHRILLFRQVYPQIFEMPSRLESLSGRMERKTSQTSERRARPLTAPPA